MPECKKTEGTCKLHKNYKIAQLGDRAGEVEVHLFSEFKPWNKRTLCTMLYL